jgi:putative membrane protein
MQGGDIMMGMGWLWFLLIALAFYLIYLNSEKSRSPRQGSISEAPLEILKKRYARGEITREQFEEMKKDLQ